ncbi:Flp family type IVb pilin [Novosphingobium guangzhouense]|uniref:Pilus assembly protein n=1 Tax=Novosphingobium guangzhouense TaxID=1850347 RepID=A0A2K2G2M2_9SPHN|nr:Flp family type IVb pilin [Novosphingobium guangzhouense]PNU05283.1 pilus assembly protein [Novosphingobium guangzhouense]
MRFHRLLKTIIENRDGASTVEYGMILAFIVLAVFATLQGVASQTVSMWNTVATKSSAATNKN